MLPIATVSETATVRLLPTAYYKAPVLHALVELDEDRGLLAAIDALTSRRRRARRVGLPGLDQRELSYGGWGESCVNAAFAYARPGGNRFNDSTRGAWYCAFEDRTAIEEVAFHRTRELRAIGVFDDEVIYQSLLAGFVGEFPDARTLPPESGVLGSEPERAYPLGQALARELAVDGADGLLYPSVRHRGGTCLVAFRPQAVRNVRPGARWMITWSGSPRWSATTA